MKDASHEQRISIFNERINILQFYLIIRVEEDTGRSASLINARRAGSLPVLFLGKGRAGFILNAQPNRVKIDPAFPADPIFHG